MRFCIERNGKCFDWGHIHVYSLFYTGEAAHYGRPRAVNKSGKEVGDKISLENKNR